MTNDERNTALAALIGAEGYEAARECPQGHEMFDENMDPRENHIGDLCYYCSGINSENELWYPERAEEFAAHPEWRIQSVPKDFTVPGVLEPLAEQLLEKWNREPAERYYMWTHTFLPNDERVTHAVNISYFPFHPKPRRAEFQDTHPAGYGEGMTYEVALGEALLDTDTERRRS